MSVCTQPETRKSRKARRCDSCGEAIDVGGLYRRWRCFDARDAETVQMHPECHDAHLAAADGEDYEFSRHGHARGSAE